MTSSKSEATEQVEKTGAPSYKITQKDFNQINRRNLFGFQLGWNYERMQGSGYLYTMLPLMRKIYGDGTPELRAMMRTQNQFMNVSNFFSSTILGIDMAIEEREGIAGAETIAGIKTGLMGPLSAVGDAIFGSLLPTIFGALAASMAVAGNPLGVIIWTIECVVTGVFRWMQLPFAYKAGVSLVTTMRDKLSIVTESASILGVFMVGSLIASNIGVVFTVNPTVGGATINLQSTLDMMLPGLLPAGIVAAIYWMLGKKGITSTKAIFIVLVAAVALSAFGIIAKG